MAMYKVVFIASLLLSVLYLTAAQVTTASGTTWTVPGIYNYYVPGNTARVGISCVGGSGGNNYYLANGGGNSAGNGASAYGEFYVSPGQRLVVVVGGKGGDAQTGSFSNGAGGGGGGSFVWNPSDLTYPMVAAGGGGGSAALSLGGTNYIGKDGAINVNGIATTSGGLDDPPQPGYSAASASGGKGWIEVRYNPIGRDSSSYVGAVGGYGGGGANYGQAAGGGGGYSGGPAGYTDGSSAGKVGGGGGGSYVSRNGFRVVIQSQSQPGNGFVTISTKLACQNGGSLNNVNSSCICLSGYKGISCELSPSCQGVNPLDNVTTSYPLLADDDRLSNITNNNLNLVLQGPYVMSRKYTSLTFSGGVSRISDSCTLHGGNSWWSQTFADGWTCSDMITLSLPWKNHTNCGFTMISGDANSATVTYLSRMQLSYSEDTGDHYGLDILRTVSHAYEVTVTFPRNVQAEVSPIKINSVVLFDCVLADETYDYVNNQMKITLQGISPWSSMLGVDPLGVQVPSNMNLINTPVLDNSKCKMDPGSSCVQQFFLIVKLKNESECSYNGNFKISSMIYSCRENNGVGCNSAPVNMTFTMRSGSVCPALTVTPSVSADLQIFHTLDFSDPRNVDNFNYKLGQQAFFYMNINAGAGNTVDLYFRRIQYFNNGTWNPLYDANGNAGFSAEGLASKMALMRAGKYFSMYFSGTVFKIPFGETRNFTIQCTATVVYDGNTAFLKKRDIESTWTVGADGTPLQTGVSFALSGSRHAAEAIDEQIISQKGDEASGVSLYTAVGIAAAGVVTGLVAVVAVVVVVFKKFTARLQQEKAATPLLTQSL